MASGTVRNEAPTASAKASARRSSSGKAESLAHAGDCCAGALEDHDVVDGVVDRSLGGPAGALAQEARVGLAPPQLLEALVISLLVWHEADLGIRAGPRDHALSELEDRGLDVIADVEHLPPRGLRVEQPQ